MPYDLSVRGWMSENELKVIEKWAQLVPENGIIVEIGAMMGRTACAWAMSAHPSVKVYCLDMWSGWTIQIDPNIPEEECLLHGFPFNGDINSIDTFIENTKEFENIIPIKVDDPYVVPALAENLKPNLVFLDAGHENPADWFLIEKWLPKVVPGGLFCGHDLSPQFSDVIENIDSLEKMMMKKVTKYDYSSLWSFVIDKKKF
jgi:hypothetical protein